MAIQCGAGFANNDKCNSELENERKKKGKNKRRTYVQIMKVDKIIR